MRLLEKLSGTIFNLFARKYARKFESCSPDFFLRKSLSLLDTDSEQQLKSYIRTLQTPSGGFPDKAGKPDIYYTLFGFLLAGAMDMPDVKENIARFLENDIKEHTYSGVHLYCTGVLSHVLPVNTSVKKEIDEKLLKASDDNEAKVYDIFLQLITYYFRKDYRRIFRMRHRIDSLHKQEQAPCPVIAAQLVLQRSFGGQVKALQHELLDFYSQGGFRAVRKTPVNDLLSTAVALYALNYSGADLRTLKPACLGYIDSLFDGGGFGSNPLDPEPDIEYTFYGVLALGALAD